MRLDETYTKFRDDEILKEKFIQAVKEGTLKSFIEEVGLECTKEELVTYVKDMAEQANGKECEAILTSFATIDFSCAVSKIEDNDPNCGI